MNLRKSDLVSMYEKMSKNYRQDFLNDILRPTGRGGVYAARDYIAANAVLAELNKVREKGVDIDYDKLHCKKDTKFYLSSVVRFRLAMYTPCLAYRFDELKDKERENIFNNKDIIFTEKENGVRGVFVFAGHPALFSRNYSQKDCGLPEYWGNINQQFNGDKPFAIDCEIKYEPDSDVKEQLEEFGLSTDSKLEAMAALLQMNSEQSIELQKEYERLYGKPLIVFRLITTLYYNGVDYRKRTLGEAWKIEKEVIEYARERGLNVVPIRKLQGTKSEKEAFLDSILEEGGEGIVAHNLKGVYNTTENRDKNVFVKLKRSVAATAAKQGMGDTIEGFITGFTMSKEGTGDEGLIGSFEVSAFIKDADGRVEQRVIAYVPNIERAMKIQYTIKDFEGNTTMDPLLYGQVVEVDGQEVSRVSKRLTHPRLIRFRFDKLKEDCVYTKQFWESQMDVNLTNVGRNKQNL